MNATNIGPVEDALIGLLQADAVLSTIAGPPQLGPPASPAHQHVWIAPGVVAVDRVDLSGGSERVETFTLQVVCFAATTGSDFAQARDASSDLATRVAEIVDDNFHLSFQVGIVDVHVTGVEREYAAWDKVQGIVHSVGVTCEVILT